MTQQNKYLGHIQTTTHLLRFSKYAQDWRLEVLAKSRATLLQHLRKVEKQVGGCGILSIRLSGVGGDHFWHQLHPCGKKEHTNKSNKHRFQIIDAHIPRGHRTNVFQGESYTRSPSWIPGEVGRMQRGHGHGKLNTADIQYPRMSREICCNDWAAPQGSGATVISVSPGLPWSKLKRHKRRSREQRHAEEATDRSQVATQVGDLNIVIVYYM